MTHFEEIVRRHGMSKANYSAFAAYHKAQKHSTATLEQAPEHTIHRDREWLINRVLELEGNAPEPPHDYVKDGILTPESVRELEGYMKDA